MKKRAIILIILIIGMTSCGRHLIKESDANIKMIKAAVKRYISSDWEVRLNVVQEITRYINPTDNNILEISLLYATNDEHPAVRIEALRGLAKLRSKNSIKRIKEIASDDKNDNVRWYAVKTLGLYKDPSSLDVFIKGFNSEDWLIREASIVGMLMIDDISVKEKIIPYIIKALNDSNESIVISTLKNVKIKDEKIYQEIITIFKKKGKSNYTFLRAILTAMNGYKLDDETRNKTINLLIHPNKNIRLLALKILKKEKMLKNLEK